MSSLIWPHRCDQGLELDLVMVPLCLLLKMFATVALGRFDCGCKYCSRYAVGDGTLAAGPADSSQMTRARSGGIREDVTLLPGQPRPSAS